MELACRRNSVADYVIYFADDAAGANRGASSAVSVVGIVRFGRFGSIQTDRNIKYIDNKRYR